MKRFKYVVCLILILNGHLFAQSIMQRKADQLFNELSYLAASEHYLDLVKPESKASESNIRKLADCYFKIAEFAKAEKYYALLLNKFPATITEADLIAYLQVLKYNEKYSDTKKVLALLEAKRKDNLILKNHAGKDNYVKELKEDSAAYKITNVEKLNTENSEFSPVLFNNGKGVLFASNRRNTSLRNKTFAWDDTYFMDVYAASKSDSMAFSNIMAIDKDLRSLYHDGPVSLSPDANTLYLTRSNVLTKKLKDKTINVVNLKLYIIQKDAKGNYSEPLSFPYNSDDYSLGHATITKDGKRLYFVSDMPGGYGQTDLYVSELKNGAWQQPQNLGQAINSEGREMFPYVHEDGTLFFSSDGRAGLGGLDIYFAVPEIDVYFEPQSLGYPLNSHLDDFGFALNSDLKTGYFSSNRSGGKGKDDIYYFRSREAIIGSSLTGIVFDESNKEPVPNAKVYLLDKNKRVVDSVVSNSKGEYSLQIKDPSQTWFVGAKEPGKYYDRVVSAGKLSNGENKLDVGLYPKYKLVCEVRDMQTGEPVEGVKATFKDNTTKQTKEYATNTSGTFEDIIRDKKPGDKLDLSIVFEKEGYIKVEKNFSVVLDENTIIDLKEKIQKFVIGADIAKVIDIKPIYFDLAKWNIRPDAAKELDKIVKVMNENPTMVIELGSHTDCRGTSVSNLSLSDKRAKSSAAYIVSKGIAKERIYGKGYGESKLINHCECEGKRITPCTEEEHQANRRTEFLIVKY